MTLQPILYVIILTYVIYTCKGCSQEWGEWGSCSTSCGGGTQHRSSPSYCCSSTTWLVFHHKDCHDAETEHRDCNNFCYNGGTYTVRRQSWIFKRSCKCPYRFYGKCCQYRCPPISDCKDWNCSSIHDNVCLSCRDKIRFKLENANKLCTRTCSHDNRWCWPGKCPQQYAKSCICAPGFRRQFNSNAATCQPTITPNIITCMMRAVSSRNEILPQQHTRSSRCSDQIDFFGNIQVVRLEATLDAEFVIAIPETYHLPAFVKLYKFGITDVTVKTIKYSISGLASHIKTVLFKKDSTRGEQAEENYSSDKNKHITYTGTELLSGERLCLQYEVKGGGYFESYDQIANRSWNVPYEKTNMSSERCYRFDDTRPEHESDSSEPLELSSRLLSSRQLNVTFSDWIDKSPDINRPHLASGIASYEVSIYEVVSNTTETLARGLKSIIPKTVFNASRVFTFSVPEATRSPSLFCVMVEVTDVANNARQARRFFLFDNSSEITVQPNKKIQVTTASNETGQRWQTNFGMICYSWIGRFVNAKYVTFNPLRPIEPDPYELVTGKYDQNTGFLSIKGTSNINGIVKFAYSVENNNVVVIPATDVRNFMSQNLCVDVAIKDGDAVTLNLEATDIISNKRHDSTTIYIDRTVPEIKNVWLLREGYKQLYVHNSSHLNKMKLSFEAMDPHSGLKTILWKFGAAKNEAQLGNGSIDINKLAANGSCPDLSSCYCPSVGNCEYYNFTLSMGKLEVHADHNRRYFFKLKVTNNAMLTSIEHIDVLVDVSPPETGVVMEGPVGSPDIDFTAGDTVMVHWQGFIDHESGIKLYKLAISDRCLQTTDLKNDSLSILETTDTSMRIPLQYTGTTFVTVIAYNNAMEPSVPACSDGITRDETPPVITDVSLQSASIQDRLACSGGNAWLIKSNLSRVLLNSSSDDCFNRCKNSSINEFVEILPIERTENKDISISSFICQRIETYNDTLVYLPTDGIILKWNIADEYSQIQDVKVGIGSSRKSNGLPDITGYSKSHHINSYSKHHLGLSGGTEFFIFIKARNKAGLETVASYGPVLIDETPPICNDNFNVSLRESRVVLTWNQTTCYDLEQREEIGSIFFRIGYSDKFITPFMEWRISESPPCEDGESRCIHYPVKRLQQYVTESGDPFYFDLHVYNYAGHYRSHRTKSFHVPSKIPPPCTIVLDIEPSEISKAKPQDTDISFNPRRFCAAWSFVKRYSDVTFQIGLGTGPTLDDVMAYAVIDQDIGTFCDDVPLFKNNTRYFTSLRSTRNKTVRYSVSDGFVVVGHTDISAALSVYDGKGCSKKSNIGDVIVHIPSDAYNHSFHVDALFHPGNIYTAILTASNVILTSKEIMIIKVKIDTHVNVVVFSSLIEYPQFQLKASYNVSQTVGVAFQACVEDTDFVLATDNVTAHWELIMNEVYRNTITHFYVTIRRESQNVFAKTVNAFSLSSTSGIYVFALDEEVKLSNGFYITTVKPCVSKRCLDPASSNGFWVLPPTAKIGQIHASIIKTKTEPACQLTELEFDKFICSQTKNISNTVWYRWALFKDKEGMKQLSNWNIVHSKSNDKEYALKDSACIVSPVYSHADMFICLEGYCISGSSRRHCVSLSNEQNPNEYGKKILYEMNTDQMTDDLKKASYSANVGGSLSVVHDRELDFTTSDGSIGGIIVGVEDWKVTWYLMKRGLPTFIDCDKEDDCVTSLQTTGGIVEFPRLNLLESTIYYLCATVNSKPDGTRNGTFHVCGDGFAVDDMPPTKGQVHIISENGFIVNNVMTIEWSGFLDLQDEASLLGYPSGISHYSYSIGSCTGCDEVVEITDVALSEAVIVREVDLKPGMTYYATVYAHDHAGHVTEVSSAGVTFDNTAPTRGSLSVGHQYMVIGNGITVYWKGFADTESGIRSIQAGIGSNPFTTDVIPFLEFHSDHVVFDKSDAFSDGHVYYAFLRVTNRAGLSTIVITDPFIIDNTPPTTGHVKDGLDTDRDYDYQYNTTHIRCYWDGFEDPHSNVSYYSACIGTEAWKCNIKPSRFNALNQDIVWALDFTHGVRYYCMVQACNAAGLCSSQSSNGIIIDNSPPIPGIVYIGMEGSGSKFVAKRNMLQARWIGFEDPHSDMSHFEACIGTRQGSNFDVMPFTNYLLSSSFIKTELNMPVNTPLYVTVRGYNKAGLYTDKTSDSFFVDTTPPELVTRLTFQMDINANGTQTDVSFFKLFWKFQDPESSVIRQSVTLRTHHDGHSVLDNLRLGGETEIAISLDKESWFHDGDTYFAEVTSCNQAGLCKTSTSDGLLIDSTPPKLGGFKPPMTWHSKKNATGKVSTVSLTWYGFSDLESNIQNYFVTIGTSYSGSELSGGVITIPATSSKEQAETFDLQSNATINHGQKIILSIWAENYAGLKSAIGKITVEAVATDDEKTKGNLFIEKHSCDVHYYNKDCTCAVVGKSCDNFGVNMTCKNISQSDLHVVVNAGLTSSHQALTPSSACLSGNWRLLSEHSAPDILRYEWSIGQKGFQVGNGIFGQEEKVWQDVGKDCSFTYCLPTDRSLQNGFSYVVYMRALTSLMEYSLFQSKEILVDTTPPSIRKGKFIKISDDSCIKSLFYSSNTSTLTVCWKNVFAEQESKIGNFLVNIGTSPGSDDVVRMTEVGLSTRTKWSNLTLFTGTKYYATVTANNTVGLHTSSTSYGLIIDTDQPYTGVVFNTKYHRNTLFQSSNILEVSYHGFEDHGSFIKTYMIAVKERHRVHEEIVSQFRPVGISTSLPINYVHVQNGREYQFLVKAVDAAGHKSDVATSPWLQIDNSPPSGFECLSYESIANDIVDVEDGRLDWSFSNITDVNNVYRLHLEMNILMMNATVILSAGDMVRKLFMASNPDGSSETEMNVFLRANDTITISVQGIPDTVKGKVFLTRCNSLDLDNPASSFVLVRQISQSSLSVDVNVLDMESGIREVHIGTGTSDGGFQIQPLTMIPYGSPYILHINVQHASPVFVTALIENNAGGKIKFQSKRIIMDMTPPTISNISVTKVNDASMQSMNTTNISVTWTAGDKETKIKHCQASLDGGNGVLVDWMPSDGWSIVFTDVIVGDGTVLIAKVRCVNNVGLVGEASKQETVLIRAPDSSDSSIHFHKNMVTRSGMNVQTNQSRIIFSWDHFEDTLGLDRYECRIFDGAEYVTNWQSVGDHNYALFKEMYLQNDHVYNVEVRAVNKGDMYSNVVNNTILVLHTKPHLSGIPAVMSQNQGVLTLDWSEVFITDDRLSVTFQVSLGSRYGTNDIIRRAVTSDMKLNIRLNKPINQAFLVVYARYDIGGEQVYKQTL